MSAVLYTTDTELSFVLHGKGLTPLENLRIAVMGEVSDGTWGIGYQMARLDAHGLKGVFFVEALHAHIFGIDVLKRIVDPILDAGHEVQLHLHTEWLKWADKDVLGGRRAWNPKDFAYDDQRVLLEMGIEALEKAGAPRPIAFRSGNYAANNDTLRALASLGIAYDSSYNHPYWPKTSAIASDEPLQRPTRLDGLIEVPITYFEDYPGHHRSLQLCAASLSEFDAVLRQSLAQDRPTTVIVSHSFELLNVRRTRANRMLLRRLDDYCALLESKKHEVKSMGFEGLDPRLADAPAPAVKPLTSNAMRTAFRMIEQSVGTYLYDRA